MVAESYMNDLIQKRFAFRRRLKEEFPHMSLGKDLIVHHFLEGVVTLTQVDAFGNVETQSYLYDDIHMPWLVQCIGG